MWRIYYGDGRTHDGQEGLPTGEEARGVQAILQKDADVGWIVTSEADYYVWRDGRWWGVDLNGLFDFLLDTGLVVFGRVIGAVRFREILNMALDERERRRHD